MHRPFCFRAVASTLLLTGIATAQPVPPPPGPRVGPTGPVFPSRPVPISPIAPGSIQRPNMLPLPSAPQLWTFANIKAEGVDPVTIRVSWASREGATHYVVRKDGAFLAETVAGTNQVLDDAMAPGKMAAYEVDAIARKAPPPSRTGFVPSTPKGLTLAATVLETSQKRSGATPSLDPPRDFAIALDSRRTNLHGEWSLPKWVKAIEVVRDGTAVTRLPATTTSFDEAMPNGSHTYAARVTFTAGANKPTFTSAPTPDLTLRKAPFRIVAAGDSIMWGQGLGEAAKFTALTRDAIRPSLGMDVELTSFAHSGAIIRSTTSPFTAIGLQDTTPFDQTLAATPGEVPNSFGTIFQQVNVQAALSSSASVARPDVDLVLVDGCANDVGIMNVLNPKTPPGDLRALVQAKCAPMTDLITRVNAIFPNASIIVTGYYPIISMESDLSAVAGLVALVVGPAALVVIPPDPVLATAAVIAGLVGQKALRESLTANSTAFAESTTNALRASVTAANQRIGAPRALLAVPAFGTRNTYGAPSTWLWAVPTGAPAGQVDDVLNARITTCRSPGVMARASGVGLVPGATIDPVDRTKCENASMGHPNQAGARAYGAAIQSAFAAELPRWRERYALTRKAAR